jgi:hypothetical protein
MKGSYIDVGEMKTTILCILQRIKLCVTQVRVVKRIGRNLRDVRLDDNASCRWWWCLM